MFRQGWKNTPNKPTGRQTPDLSAHSWGAGVTGNKMFSQQWREKCFCGVTKHLNIISVLYKQTHNAAYDTVFYLAETIFPCWCWQNCQWWSAQEDKRPILSQRQNVREDETSTATEFCWMNALHRLLNFINHVCLSHIQLQTVFQSGHCLDIQWTYTFRSSECYHFIFLYFTLGLRLCEHRES